jgi:hypothetical protein
MIQEQFVGRGLYKLIPIEEEIITHIYEHLYFVEKMKPKYMRFVERFFYRYSRHHKYKYLKFMLQNRYLRFLKLYRNKKIGNFKDIKKYLSEYVYSIYAKRSKCLRKPINTELTELINFAEKTEIAVSKLPLNDQNLLESKIEGKSIGDTVTTCWFFSLEERLHPYMMKPSQLREFKKCLSDNRQTYIDFYTKDMFEICEGIYNIIESK